MHEKPRVVKIQLKDISDTDKHIRLSDFEYSLRTLLRHVVKMEKVGFKINIEAAKKEILNIQDEVNKAREVLDLSQETSVELLIPTSVESLMQISERINKLIKKYPSIFSSIDTEKEWL